MFRRLLISSAAFGVVAAGAAAQGVKALAPATQSYTFPPIAVASTETLQVNLTNIANSSVQRVGATQATPVCSGTVTVTNATGQVIGKANPFSVGFNAIQSITVPYGSTGATGGARVLVLVTVQRTLTAGTPCNLIYSLETYLATTGETHVLLPGNGGGFTPMYGMFVLAPPPPGGGNGNGEHN